MSATESSTTVNTTADTTKIAELESLVKRLRARLADEMSDKNAAIAKYERLQARIDAANEQADMRRRALAVNPDIFGILPPQQARLVRDSMRTHLDSKQHRSNHHQLVKVGLRALGCSEREDVSIAELEWIEKTAREVLTGD